MAAGTGQGMIFDQVFLPPADVMAGILVKGMGRYDDT